MQKIHKSLLQSVIRGLGTGAILALALTVTCMLYQYEVEDKVFTNNYTTSVLYSNSLSSASGAAPWALLSLTWFSCRALLKRWWTFIAARFA